MFQRKISNKETTRSHANHLNINLQKISKDFSYEELKKINAVIKNALNSHFAFHSTVQFAG